MIVKFIDKTIISLALDVIIHLFTLFAMVFQLVIPFLFIALFELPCSLCSNLKYFLTSVRPPIVKVTA